MKSNLSFLNISTGKYIISNILNPNPKFTGLGLIEGNIIEVIRTTKHLVHFKICNTEMFARRSDINMVLSIF